MFKICKSATWGWYLRLLGVHLPYPRIPTKSSRLWVRRFKGLSREDIKVLVKNQFIDQLGQVPNLDTPRTFSEKLCWLKINYRNPLVTICADKVCSRDYFLRLFPDRKDLLVDQLSVCNSWKELDFDKYPNSFVLKSNWGSGAQIIVKDKSNFNPSSVKRKVNCWMSRRSNHYYNFFEWGYKNIVPKIIVEEFLHYEYKMEFFCFNGTPKFFWIVFNDKTSEVKANFYDLNFIRIPVMNHYPNFDQEITTPAFFDEMVTKAQKMAADFPFVRCDFYVTKKGFRFSEMTFFHWAGYCDFEPPSYDLKFGDMMKLPQS